MTKKYLKDLISTSQERKIVCLTAYSYPLAKLIDPFVDLILVGDSLAMVVYGYDDTMSVSLPIMIEHGKAVSKGANNACIVIDMPFGTYENSCEEAFKNASQVLVETNASAVKIEVDFHLLDTVEYLINRAIPIIAHIGLKPTHVRAKGGYKAEGKSQSQQEHFLQLALKLEQLGVDIILIEALNKHTTDTIIQNTNTLIIGIGASDLCHGQILVTEDILDLYDNPKAKFVKTYADLNSQIKKAVESYAQEVITKKFPTPLNIYT